MNQILARGLAITLLVMASVGFVAAWLEREAAAGLTRELELLRDENRQLTVLRAENEQLKADQIPNAELVRLRADRSALLRLRNEVDQLRSRVEQRAKRVE